MSIVAQAKTELDLINFGEEDTKVMIEILEKFFDQWDSGGAVAAVAPILQRCIAGKPLSPLTGADSEWMAVSGGPNDMTWQNKRCSSVFKEQMKNGEYITYDIDRLPNPGVPEDAKLIHRWAANWITFPYRPDKSEVSDPVMVVDTER